MYSEWVDAITKTVSQNFDVYTEKLIVFTNTFPFSTFLLQLPPPPQIELVVDKPHLMNVLRRPLVRIRRKFQIILYILFIKLLQIDLLI